MEVCGLNLYNIHLFKIFIKQWLGPGTVINVPPSSYSKIVKKNSSYSVSTLKFNIFIREQSKHKSDLGECLILRPPIILTDKIAEIISLQWKMTRRLRRYKKQHGRGVSRKKRRWLRSARTRYFYYQTQNKKLNAWFFKK